MLHVFRWKIWCDTNIFFSLSLPSRNFSRSLHLSNKLSKSIKESNSTTVYETLPCLQEKLNVLCLYPCTINLYYSWPFSQLLRMRTWSLFLATAARMTNKFWFIPLCQMAPYRIGYMVLHIKTNSYFLFNIRTSTNFLLFHSSCLGAAAKRKTLDWPARLSIALGAARGKYARLCYWYSSSVK